MAKGGVFIEFEQLVEVPRRPRIIFQLEVQRAQIKQRFLILGIDFEDLVVLADRVFGVTMRRMQASEQQSGLDVVRLFDGGGFGFR